MDKTCRSGLVAGIVEGGVGSAGVLAPPMGSAPSVTSNMMEPVPSRPFVVAVNQQCRT